MLELFANEIKDGLTLEVLSKPLSFACELLADDLNQNSLLRTLACQHLDRSLASVDGQIDLFHMKSILVTAGWNKNDDVFDTSELWISRHTPEDKPLNIEHNSKEIIGHITANYPIDFDGNIIEDESKCPEKFHIVTNSVLYRALRDVEQKKRIEQIIAEISKGEWFVSMECLFSSFDYAISGEGKQYVIARDESSSFLTKHLRAYGGTGEYGNYKIGRLMRNMVFSGHGLVKRPANPNSVILNSEAFNSQEEVKAEEIMANDNTKDGEVTRLSEVLASLTKEKDDLSAQLEKALADINGLKTDLTAKNDENKDLKSRLDESVKAHESVKIDLEASNKRVTEAEAEISDIKATAKVKERMVQIAKVCTLSEAEAADWEKKIKGVSDEVFATMLEFAGKVKPTASATESVPDPKVLEEVKTETEASLATASDNGEEVEEARVSLANLITSYVKPSRKGGK